MRPEPGVIPLALETPEARVVRCPWRRQIARRHDAKPRGDDMALIGLYRPCVCLAVEDRLSDARVELNFAPQIEVVGDVVDVTQDLRLRAVALRPAPILLQFVGEGIRILEALDVATAPRIAVPVPGPADIAARLEGAHAEAELTQAIDRIEAANAGADDNRIIFRF